MKYVVNTKKYSFKFGNLLQLKSLAVAAVSDELLAKLRKNFMFKELEAAKKILVEDTRPIRGDDDTISALKARIAELEADAAKSKKKRTTKKSADTEAADDAAKEG